ncbi:MAG: DedA family protein [Blastocatellia bacterium]|nr:DedA family protein [Blastocatellia bacterium]MBL8197223.1 DedA family protein [Blastocatellia bacterium]
MKEQLKNIIELIKANKIRAAIVIFILLGVLSVLIVAAIEVHKHLTIDVIAGLIKKYGYYTIFALVMLGNMGVPVPEESPVILAGYASHEKWLNYEVAVIVCIVSAILGDNIGYMIGRRGGRPLILRYGRYVGLTEAKLNNLEGFFERYGDKTVFVARFIAGLRWAAGPLSGAARMPVGRFMFYNATGAVVWVFIMTQLGYHLASNLPYVLKLVGQAKIFIIGGAIIAFIAYRYHKKRKLAAADQKA